MSVSFSPMPLNQRAFHLVIFLVKSGLFSSVHWLFLHFLHCLYRDLLGKKRERENRTSLWCHFLQIIYVALAKVPSSLTYLKTFAESDDDNDDNDSWDARQTVCRASNTHEEAPGPMVPAPPSATNNAPSHTYQKDAAVTSTEDLLKPSSTSKSPDPRHDTQASTQPAGTGVSMKPEPVIGVSTIKKEDSSLTEGEVDGGTEECLEKLGAIKARLKYLMQGTRLEHERSATFRG